jgi:hypothetical protein
MMPLLAAATAAVTLTFVSYGAFFSSETKQVAPIDPQVFVKDATAAAGAGPELIDHDAGLRTALLSDPPDTNLFNAQAAPVGMTLKQWLGARGTVEIAQLNANAQNVTVHFDGLSPYGVYSLFEGRYEQQATVSAPLDGIGTSNSFIADAGGGASLTLLVTPPLGHGSTIVLVFHSDGRPHGMSPGGVGVTAHNQLIVVIP